MAGLAYTDSHAYLIGYPLFKDPKNDIPSTLFDVVQIGIGLHSLGFELRWVTLQPPVSPGEIVHLFHEIRGNKLRQSETSRLVLYFATHGQNGTGDLLLGDPNASGNERLYPLKSLYENIAQLQGTQVRPLYRHILVIFDSCHSGEITRLPMPHEVLQTMDLAALGIHNQLSWSLEFLTASNASQAALDMASNMSTDSSKEPEQIGGMLSHQLIKLLSCLPPYQAEFPNGLFTMAESVPIIRSNVAKTLQKFLLQEHNLPPTTQEDEYQDVQFDPIYYERPQQPNQPKELIPPSARSMQLHYSWQSLLEWKEALSGKAPDLANDARILREVLGAIGFDPTGVSEHFRNTLLSLPPMIERVFERLTYSLSKGSDSLLDDVRPKLGDYCGLQFQRLYHLLRPGGPEPPTAKEIQAAWLNVNDAYPQTSCPNPETVTAAQTKLTHWAARLEDVFAQLERPQALPASMVSISALISDLLASPIHYNPLLVRLAEKIHEVLIPVYHMRPTEPNVPNLIAVLGLRSQLRLLKNERAQVCSKLRLRYLPTLVTEAEFSYRLDQADQGCEPKTRVGLDEAACFCLLAGGRLPTPREWSHLVRLALVQRTRLLEWTVEPRDWKAHSPWLFPADKGVPCGDLSGTYHVVPDHGGQKRQEPSSLVGFRIVWDVE